MTGVLLAYRVVVIVEGLVLLAGIPSHLQVIYAFFLQTRFLSWVGGVCNLPLLTEIELLGLIDVAERCDNVFFLLLPARVDHFDSARAVTFDKTADVT